MVSKDPKKIAIILDGNRRFAKKLGLQPWKGHEFGAKKLEKLLKWCQDLGIKELTLYAFSTENFTRSKREIKFLFNIFRYQFKDSKYRKGIFKNRVRTNFIGRLGMFPPDIRKTMVDLMQKTKKHDNLTVNFAMAYGGRQEITDAVKKIVKQVKANKLSPNSIKESTITKNIYLQNEPDLVIRPGGEMRTSNFLMWQSAYSEWFFIKKLWPEFTKKDLIKIIKEFNQRERRFGK